MEDDRGDLIFLPDEDLGIGGGFGGGLLGGLGGSRRRHHGSTTNPLGLGSTYRPCSAQSILEHVGGDSSFPYSTSWPSTLNRAFDIDKPKYSWSLRRNFPQLDELRTEVQRRDQEIMAMAAKMKTLEDQHQDYQRHIAVLKESLCAKEEHYNMLQADVSLNQIDFHHLIHHYSAFGLSVFCIHIVFHAHVFRRCFSFVYSLSRFQSLGKFLCFSFFS